MGYVMSSLLKQRVSFHGQKIAKQQNYIEGIQKILLQKPLANFKQI